MRLFLTLIVMGLLIGYFPAQRKTGRDRIDPSPNVPPYPGSNSGSKGSRTRKPPDPPPLNETYLQRELDSYVVGQPTHRDSLRFSETIANEVKNLIKSGRRIEKIIVTGFADGIPNKGIKYDLGHLSSDCQKGISAPLDDTELALLRGCIILEQISRSVGSPSVGIIGWRKDEYDEPDGGKQGAPYRKVRVEIFLRKL